MTIANRILLGFMAITLLLLGLGLYGLNQISVVTAATDMIITRDIAALRQLAQLRDTEAAMQDSRGQHFSRFLLRNLGRGGGTDDLATQWSREAEAAERLMREMQAAAEQNLATAVSPERRSTWQRVGRLLVGTGTQLQRIRSQTRLQLEAIRNEDLAAAIATGDAVTAVRAEFDQSSDALRDALNDLLAAGQQRGQEVYKESRMSVLAVLLGALALGIVITLLIRRSITAPLATFSEFVGRVGRGDLSGPPAATGRDELGQLGATLNAMVEGLRQLARQSREATENLNAAAAEIRASTQEQAASVEEQLAAVQETAATVDEITHSGTQIGKRAQEVIASAQATAQTSNAGLKAVDETVHAMEQIREQGEAVAANIVALSEKTQAIGEIIASVNDISERSHLLALNAAIEAAAAGEQGRSFAVVAAEMKTLAHQAKDATAQVRSILGDIQRGINSSVMLTEEAVKRVAAGRERTDTTHTTITEITGRIQDSVHTFQQIVASTNQQQLGIEQVMSALQNIRQASQQTAVGTRQLDTAAANLSLLSQQLVTLADRYRI
ncbi:methyl-accepting chemotaxis protein [Teichococcus vastitatis]|uniref:Methyl-accepting chemotaxis protein n=1 Tax=Teichococcus vastitatis TaxID=2307076 RepID=A0ABS9W9R6_9PROT|nr:methyl-accepting chemotaxis protein [Pseudoroseomonas vastitatis]MCI0755987.1 methyl-accepting chemotaxis protein [Pseudoroseomonas vastitatis]